MDWAVPSIYLVVLVNLYFLGQGEGKNTVPVEQFFLLVPVDCLEV